jgi:DNA replication initiation complex subunit (GINS family)
MGEIITITYETLFEMLRNEKNRDELQRLNPDFIEEVSSYINEKRNSLNEQLSLYSEDERNKANRQIFNLKSILRELYEKRERKLVVMALNKSRTDAIIDTSLMLPSEKEMFDKLLEVFNENRKEFMKKAFEQTKIVKVKEETKEEEEEDDNEETDDEVETKLVRFLAPVPKFMGKELEVYGPFEEEDVASLPKEIAELLIKKGRAEELSED